MHISSMASFGTTTTLACVLLLSTLFTSYADVPATNCKDDMNFIAPCLGYLTGKATTPASNCCLGMQNFYNAAGKTAESRKIACECFKNESKGHRDLKPERVPDLPVFCKRPKSPPFKISLNMNCSDLR
ncbi:hypothetical protein H6P81_017279 [Aristolochia fimbriata]|uniref:Bifunctional inhibitor/plant lipid transfer protein/seed storage helical domain-containing protein n=1 Tax=Aristolochia fimbriata TaxID=158543 RepID=A0AAV7DXQ5_ARIFI|nr:hypothetical protein H6P81_017279 [Aristolochia fimbriata]